MPQPNKAKGAVWDRREVKSDFASEKFKDNWDKIFGKKEEPCPTSNPNDDSVSQSQTTSEQPNVPGTSTTDGQ